MGKFEGDIFSNLIVVMVSWVCIYILTYQITSLKYVHAIIYQLCLIEAVKKQKTTDTSKYCTCRSSHGEVCT